MPTGGIAGNGGENRDRFVLIHGAYQGGWIWKFVSERLRAKGHNVLAPTLDGCGERAAQMRAGITTETHAEEIAKLLYFHDLTNAVLVGTSSGGMVMARAAEQARERVARVVFADALASHFSRCHCSRSGTQVGCRQRSNTASAVADWAIAVRARGFTVRLGRTMRLSALLPLLGYRQLARTFISRRCGPSRGRKDGVSGQGQPRHSSGHYENRWSEVHPEANLRDGPPIDGSPVPNPEDVAQTWIGSEAN